ncbi:MAG: hypothetical protein HQ477_07800 [Chloroflexi bacterium]|nr:hypothetical protein [Chloroflexota bacterium]
MKSVISGKKSIARVLFWVGMLMGAGLLLIEYLFGNPVDWSYPQINNMWLIVIAFLIGSAAAKLLEE